eukprot:1154085_1
MILLHPTTGRNMRHAICTSFPLLSAMLWRIMMIEYRHHYICHLHPDYTTHRTPINVHTHFKKFPKFYLIEAFNWSRCTQYPDISDLLSTDFFVLRSKSDGVFGSKLWQ